MPNRKLKWSAERLRGLKLGDEGPTVEPLQQYLRYFGHFDANTGDGRSTHFGTQTLEALQSYQRYQGLAVTGEVDKDTADRMEEPRCGVPDITPPAFRALEATTTPRVWTTHNLRYRIMNFPPGLTQPQVRDAVNRAFNTWAAVCPLRFTEVAGDGADIRLRFHGAAGVDTAGGDTPFDGRVGNIVGHGFPPPRVPPSAVDGSMPGEVHFDEIERWSVPGTPPGTDLFTLALHEIGHALGLRHRTTTTSVMVTNISGVHSGLDPVDVTAIRELYP